MTVWGWGYPHAPSEGLAAPRRSLLASRRDSRFRGNDGMGMGVPSRSQQRGWPPLGAPCLHRGEIPAFAGMTVWGWGYPHAPSRGAGPPRRSLLASRRDSRFRGNDGMGRGNGGGGRGDDGGGDLPFEFPQGEREGAPTRDAPTGRVRANGRGRPQGTPLRGESGRTGEGDHKGRPYGESQGERGRATTRGAPTGRVRANGGGRPQGTPLRGESGRTGEGAHKGRPYGGYKPGTSVTRNRAHG